MNASTQTELSPAKAVLLGHLLTTAPTLIAMGAVFGAGYLSGGFDRGMLYFVVAWFPLQFWPFVFLRYWWLWAKRHTVDTERTKTLACRGLLICRKKFFEEAEAIQTGRDIFAQVWKLPVLISFAIWLFLIAALSYARPVTMVLYTKWVARNRPEMWIVPTPLPNVPFERTGGRKFAYFGYEFEVPWSDLEQEQHFASMVVLRFAKGPSIVLPDPEKGINETEVLRQTGAERGVDITPLFGKEAMRSNYALRDKTLHLTPADLNLFASRREMVGNAVLLLVVKGMYARGTGGLYSFETEWFRGFQDGSPSIDKTTVVTAFDEEDRKCEFWIGSREGSATKPSQADINAIVHSLRPASSPR